MNLSKQINQTLNQIAQKEQLIGDYQSQRNLTGTQEHILMLLATSKKRTNVQLSDELGITPAAVTKAVKRLLDEKLIKKEKLISDERQMALTLTNDGTLIAKEHARHHERTMEAYENLLKIFSPDEQRTISRFLEALKGVLK